MFITRLRVFGLKKAWDFYAHLAQTASLTANPSGHLPALALAH